MAEAIETREATETRAVDKANPARAKGCGPAAEAWTDTSAKAGSNSATESWTDRTAAEARTHGGKTARAGADGTPGESATAESRACETSAAAESPATETSVAAEAATSETSVATEATATESAMTAAEAAPASMAPATAATTTRRRHINHRYSGQSGRGERRNEHFCQHRTLLVRIGPAFGTG